MNKDDIACDLGLSHTCSNVCLISFRIRECLLLYASKIFCPLTSDPSWWLGFYLKFHCWFRVKGIMVYIGCIVDCKYIMTLKLRTWHSQVVWTLLLQASGYSTNSFVTNRRFSLSPEWYHLSKELDWEGLGNELFAGANVDLGLESSRILVDIIGGNYMKGKLTVGFLISFWFAGRSKKQNWNNSRINQY